MKLSQFILTILVAAGVGFVSAQYFAPSSGDEVSVQKESVYERVIRTGKIRCGYLNWAPLMFTNLETGRIEGVWADVTREVGKQLQLEIEWTEEISLATYLQDLNNGRYDVECSSGWPTGVRGKFVDYLDPAFFIPHYVVIREDEDRFSNENQLKQPSIRMAVIDGENTHLVQREQFPNNQTLQLPGTSQASDLALSVITNKADFTVLDKLSVDLFNQANERKLKTIGAPLSNISITYSVPSGETQLKNMIQNAMNMLVYNGKLNRILDKHDPDKSKYIRVRNPYEENQ